MWARRDVWRWLGWFDDLVIEWISRFFFCSVFCRQSLGRVCCGFRRRRTFIIERVPIAFVGSFIRKGVAWLVPHRHREAVFSFFLLPELNALMPEYSTFNQSHPLGLPASGAMIVAFHTFFFNP